MTLDARSFRAVRCALALGVAAMLGGCYQTAGLPMGATMAQMQAEDEAARNAQVVTNMRTLQMAIEQYAVDHQGLYPAPGALMTSITTEGYLPADTLPANPWAPGGLSQANELSTTGLQPALTPAGQVPTKAGTWLGTGHVASVGTYDGLTYGALVYDFNPQTQIYTLYAIGKQGDRASVVGAVTNQ
ncbi:MAG: hypothetical protein ACK46X_05690 [Candidatus Sericytochromatia bacterium]